MKIVPEARFDHKNLFLNFFMNPFCALPLTLDAHSLCTGSFVWSTSGVNFSGHWRRMRSQSPYSPSVYGGCRALSTATSSLDHHFQFNFPRKSSYMVCESFSRSIDSIAALVSYYSLFTASSISRLEFNMLLNLWGLFRIIWFCTYNKMIQLHLHRYH